MLVIRKDSPLPRKYCYCSRLLSLNALNSHVLGLNASITRLLLCQQVHELCCANRC